MVSTIDAAQAKALIRDFQNENDSNGGPGLLAPDGKHLKGFFIDRETLEYILNQGDNVAGVAFYLAKNPPPNGPDGNYATLVFSGAMPNTHAGHEPYESVGDIFFDPPPCPPYCTGGM